MWSHSYPILRAIPSIHERNALREVLLQWMGKFLYQTSIALWDVPYQRWDSHKIWTALKNGPDELQNHWKAEKAEKGRSLVKFNLFIYSFFQQLLNRIHITIDKKAKTSSELLTVRFNAYNISKNRGSNFLQATVTCLYFLSTYLLFTFRPSYMGR